MTVKLSHERKVRSLAKKTLGSTRVGSAIRFPVELHEYDVTASLAVAKLTRSCL
jgi:hypothetical protein